MLINGYLCEIELNDQTLAHYGIKGMKWGKRKTRAQIQKSKAHKVNIKTYNYGTKKKTLKDKFNDYMSKPRQDIYDNPNEINTLPINVSKMDERAAQREAARQEEERKKKKRRKAIDKAVKIASYIT